MTSIQAFLYVAGVGNRLGSELSREPQVLLELGGKSLLERHVQMLAALAIDRLVIVTGYRRESIAKATRPLSDRFGVKIVEVTNPDFREGSLLSLHASIPEMRSCEGPLLLMDGDVLYPQAMLARLLEASAPTALLVDRDWSDADDDPVLVPLRSGAPFELRKGWKGEADAVGESIGFFKIGTDDVPILIDETTSRVQAGRRSEPYEEVLRAMVLAGRFAAEDVTGMPWIEIDFPEDVERARSVILPQL